MKGDEILNAAIDVLGQGLTLLDMLDDSAYRVKNPLAFDASIGGHYRHCLDHFECLVFARGGGCVNYDSRRRDPRIETDREFARLQTMRILDACEKFPTDELSMPLAVRCDVSYSDGPGPAMASSAGREFMYAIAHSIHHYALIGILCNLHGTPVPRGFGIAPSTLKFRETEAARLSVAGI